MNEERVDFYSTAGVVFGCLAERFGGRVTMHRHVGGVTIEYHQPGTPGRRIPHTIQFNAADITDAINYAHAIGNGWHVD